MTALTFARRIRSAITRIGSTATLAEDKARTPFTASIQPVRSLQSKQSGSWGTGRRRRAALYAPWCETASRIQAGSRIIRQGQTYRVLQAETLEMAGQSLYVWAMLEPEGESAT